MEMKKFRYLLLTVSVLASSGLANTSSYRNLFEISQPVQVCPASLSDLVNMVRWADKNSKKISLVGANRSQGGQTVGQGDGLRINLCKLNHVVALDVSGKTVTVEAGITWSELQSVINGHGLAVKAMQSYADFSVGGSLSVNVHGQDLTNNPLIKSVRSFKLLTSSGELINVSRQENSELFGLVIGGYGLLGIIIEVSLDLTDDLVMERDVAILDRENFVEYFNKNIRNNPLIEFYSARFSLNSKSLLDQVIVVSYRKTNLSLVATEMQSGESASWRSLLLNQAAKFGLFATSKLGVIKNLRFAVEKLYFKSGATITRNRFMSFPLDSLPQDDSGQAYVLQEYFIPYDKVDEFLNVLKINTKAFKINLLNLTARHVNADHESVLSYALTDCCALVLYINVGKAEQAYQKVSAYGRVLIDQAAVLGGTYYLPYQLFGSKSKVHAVYPQFSRFVDRKKFYDPKEMFMNQLYLKYS